MSASLRIVVTGLITQHHRLGGITWHYLQYLLGLRRLGHDVYYVEDSGEVPYNLDGGETRQDWVAKNWQENVEYLAKILARYGFGNRWAYCHAPSSQWLGLSAEQRDDLLRSADLLINVSGTLQHPERYRRIPRLAYIDTDPVVTQVKIAAGASNQFRRRVDAHDVHFSFGERLGGDVPATPYVWRATRQPIALEEWPAAPPSGDAFTTIMNWTSYEPLRYAGRSYAQKDVEFSRFLELPRRLAPIPMEVSLSPTAHANWEQSSGGRLAAEPQLTPHERLVRAGWRVRDADETCGDLDRYREYIQSSKAEWSVAKNAYVVGQPGWFSERSACYLASGRPVIVQDTGFADVLPVGEGILAFRSIEQAVESIREVQADHRRHARAARALAEAYFDSDRVLSRLVSEAMASPERAAPTGTV